MNRATNLVLIVGLLASVAMLVWWIVMFVKWSSYKGKSEWKLAGILTNLFAGPLVSVVLYILAPPEEAPTPAKTV
jgi:hypothetical protein